jgi:hypothetical protein
MANLDFANAAPLLPSNVVSLDAYLPPATLRQRMLADVVTQARAGQVKIGQFLEELRAAEDSNSASATVAPAKPIGLETYADAVAALRSIGRVPRASDKWSGGSPVTQFDEARLALWVLALNRVHELEPDAKTGERDVDLAMRCRPKRAK